MPISAPFAWEVGSNPRGKLMSKKSADKGSTQKAQRQRAELDGQYGNIGISAVAAALPYTSRAKNPAYAPTKEQPRLHSAFGRRSIFAE